MENNELREILKGADGDLNKRATLQKTHEVSYINAVKAVGNCLLVLADLELQKAERRQGRTSLRIVPNDIPGDPETFHHDRAEERGQAR